ncbi:histidine utilization repressor [Acinetobacter bouvetii DSM 14964 = CIP 107468]|jgi:GntR family histidine utilization transcriptional repressor|uniref:Histidine utilization repressor n=3 Tax=Acinetobacter TaxID=469 RepID=N9DPG1_9GAMM|nr:MULTISPECIES: histidine utilization repressor [Acinetobacter]QXW25003.1 histidine utilization repressor [Acinetobacter johnsonii]ENV82358.1 histidine utilization repressor [Acinetobacter bouvetii DSM 14964 = CIP 107468]MCW8040910.1 histidine utilization repressor [Acinetobacter entericus]RZG64021.1 histidine utilization repressor [Acinetobacter bouvetii]TCB74346.1 histidine utilization repressor [Acinetobacter sp. ANC 4177]
MPISTSTEENKTPLGLEAPSPLYAQVKQFIQSKIYSGEWKVNDKIPSESELVKLLGCSRMTVNRALRELTADKMLVRVQGVGSFVAEGQGHSALFQINNIADEILARNHSHRAEVIKLDKIKADVQQALFMQTKEGEPLFHSIIIHYENEVPVQIEDRLVNAALIPDYLKQDFSKITPNAYLMAQAPVTEGEHIVEAVLANTQECKWLKITKQEPCLLIRRRTWSNKHLISSARLTYPGSRYYLEGKFVQ